VTAISQWIHDNIEYRYMSGRPDLSAWDVLQRGYGVRRDFAHLAIALNRAFNLPARYVTGHLPDIGFPDPENHMDFHAYAEVYLGGHWFTTDARFHVPRIGRIKVSCGQDAIDGAFSTIFGGATLTYFQVWAYQVARDTVGVGDPLDFSQRLDNRHTVHTENLIRSRRRSGLCRGAARRRPRYPTSSPVTVRDYVPTRRRSRARS